MARNSDNESQNSKQEEENSSKHGHNLRRTRSSANKRK